MASIWKMVLHNHKTSSDFNVSLNSMFLYIYFYTLVISTIFDNLTQSLISIFDHILYNKQIDLWIVAVRFSVFFLFSHLLELDFKALG